MRTLIAIATLVSMIIVVLDHGQIPKPILWVAMAIYGLAWWRLFYDYLKLDARFSTFKKAKPHAEFGQVSEDRPNNDQT